MKYCLCCGEEVPFNVIERHEKRESQCIYCGFILDVQELWEVSEDAEKGYALVVDDSKYTRKIIEDILKENNFSAHVESLENGAALISTYSKLINENKPVDLAIIDLNMPVMDGLTAASTLRTLEIQKKRAKVPIVFFSSEKADENLKERLQELTPAIYVNKTNDPDPDKLAKRVEELVSYVLATYRH